MYNTTQPIATALNTQYIHLRLLAEAVPLMVPTAQPLADSTGTPVFVLATDRLPDGQVGQENILSLSHTAVCCGSDIGIGGVYAASLSCTLNGSHSLLDVTLRAQIGAEVDGTVEWLPLGTFVVTDCRRGDDQTTFTAYDAAYYALGQDYVPTVNSGSTVAQVLTDLAQQCGLAVEPATLAMGTMAVDGDLSGHSCREMLGYLAALCGKNAVITRDGAIRFLWFAASGAAVTAEDYYDGQLSNGGTSRLSGLTCTVPADGDSREEQTLTVGDSALAVALECPYMTQERLDAIWADIGGYAYPIGDVGFYGGVLTEPGDILTLTNREGVTISFPVMQVSLSLDGGCRCQISAFGQAETSRTSARTGPLSQAVQTAAETAGRALTTAKTAMTSANGKNKVFHQGSAPAASEGLTAGDIWFDTSNDNRINTWTGAAWSAFELGTDAIANASIVNAKIADGTIQSAKIANLDAGKITAGKLLAKYIDVGNLFAQNITATGTISGLKLRGTSIDVSATTVSSDVGLKTYYTYVDGEQDTGDADVDPVDDGGLIPLGAEEAPDPSRTGWYTILLRVHKDMSESYLKMTPGDFELVGFANANIATDGELTLDAGKINLNGNVQIGEKLIIPLSGGDSVRAFGADTGDFYLGYYDTNGSWGGMIWCYEPDNNLLYTTRPTRIGTLSVTNDITQKGTTLDNTYSKQLTTATKTVSTGDVESNGTKSGTFSVSRSGYTPLGIVGWTTGTDTGNSLFNVTRLYLSGNTCNYLVRNMADSAYSCSLTVTVLYVKN